jgi:hypothetical protein
VPRKLAHRKKRDWPKLIAVCGDRVDAALATKPLSRREASARLAARGIRVAAQTLDYLCTGRQQKCREDLLAAIAQLTDVPVSWLTGELKRLPMDQGPYDDRAPNGRLRPARGYLETWRFLRQCYIALKRDFERATGQAIEQHPKWPDVHDRAMRLFTRLAEPGHLRVELFKWDDVDQPDWSDGEAAATVALTEALRWIVRPWLDDRAALHYGALQYYAGIRAATPRVPNAARQPRPYPSRDLSPGASPLALLDRSGPPWVETTTL